MALPNLTFSVASEYDGKGLGKARKDVNSFNKTVKNLAKTIGVSLSAAAVVQFGKASVRAFVDAEREGVVLTNTMKNLGLAFESSRVTSYIDNLGKLYGVTGEQAVPAMQALLSATGSVTKSQEIFNTALNVAASTGIDVAEVAKGLSQAYLGNRKALNQYNTGLTKAELQLKSFDEIQQTLDTRLQGAATAAAATYSGQLAILTENAEQAKEVIGKGLVDSFVLLAGENSLPSATTAMQDFATATAEATLGAASLIDKLQEKLSPGNFNFLGLIPVIGGYIGPGGVLDKLRQEGRKLSAETMGAPGAISGKFPVGAQYFALQEKADTAAIKRQKELAAIEKKRLDNLRKIAADAAKKLALDKASAFLNKANQIFDMDRIQLAAAAMAKQTEEDRVRIRLKTEIMDLEEAISEGNVQGAAKFAALITQDAALLGQLRDSAYNLSDVPNPFDAWLNSLNAALAALLALATVVPAVTAMVGMGGFNAGSARMGESAGNAAAGLPANSLTDFMGFGDEHLGALGRQGAVQNINVVVNNAGSTITERDLVDAITQGIYNNQASGIPINYSTVY
jgi:hypothetical protein